MTLNCDWCTRLEFAFLFQTFSLVHYMVRFLLVLCGVVFALIGNSWAGDIRIGYVNVAKLFEKAPQAERVRRDLEREFGARKKRLETEQKDIKQMEERLSRDAEVMSESERAKSEKDLINKKREAKRLQDELLEDINLRRVEESSRFQREISEAIQSLAKEDGFELVLYEGVAYASETLDITDKVQKRLQDSFGSSGKSKKDHE